jgi:peptidoglycan/xylan/chitin deacetylase (PgdA/CDA1 family)
MGEKAATPLPILMYHGVDSQNPSQSGELDVHPAQFAEHIAYLAYHQYHPITVAHLSKAARHEPGWDLPPKAIILTFDDGQADFYQNAWPILQQKNFCASLFVITSNVEKSSHPTQPSSRQPSVTWQQIHEMSAKGLEVGSHSHQHRSLDLLSLAEARREISLSKTILEEHLNHPVETFAYPYGSYTAREKTLVQQAGYSAACAVRYHRSSTQDDRYALARLIITAGTRTNTLDQLLNDQWMAEMLLRRMRAKLWRALKDGFILLKHLRTPNR